MFSKKIALPIALLFTLAILTQTAGAENPAPPANRLIPGDAIIVVSIAKPKPILDLLLQPGLIRAVESSPQWKAQTQKNGFKQFRSVVRLLERRLQDDWQSIIARLTGGGMTWSVGPGGANLFVIDATDTKVLKETHDLILFLIESEAEKKGVTTPLAPIKHGNVKIWSIGPNEAHAIIGKRLIIANSVKAVKAAIDLPTSGKAKSIASSPEYVKAIKSADAEAVATVYANTAVLKRLPKVSKSLSASDNPLAALLIGPVTEAIAASTRMTLSLTIKKNTLRIDAISNGTVDPGGASRFAVTSGASGGSLPHLAVPRRIAAMSLHRDLQGFYGAKDKLFGERTGGLVFFENMMGIFFTGRDLGREVLGQTGPKIRLVVAEQKYDPSAGKPQMQLPAFALVLPLKNPKTFSPIMEEAWQKAIGLVNFTRGQQAEPGLIIDRPVYRKTKYTVAGFSPPGPDDAKDADARFNFRPTLAMPGPWAILSSSDSLARDIMDALAKETAKRPKPSPAVHSLIDISGTQLASILTANRKTLVRQNIVDKGHTPEEAQTEIDTLIMLAKTISQAALSAGGDKDESKISLDIRLNIPSVKSGE
jgi:hypothetical protein